MSNCAWTRTCATTSPTPSRWDDWDEAEQYIYDNRQWFAGISLLPAAGDKAYAQAPLTEVHTVDEILQKYGEASMFASGLIVDGLHAVNNNLCWRATPRWATARS